MGVASLDLFEHVTRLAAELVAGNDGLATVVDVGDDRARRGLGASTTGLAATTVVAPSRNNAVNGARLQVASSTHEVMTTLGTLGHRKTCRCLSQKDSSRRKGANALFFNVDIAETKHLHVEPLSVVALRR